MNTSHTLPSYLDPDHLGPWGIYLQQVDRVTPYLGHLARWVETHKRPKRAMIVDVPIELDNGCSAAGVRHTNRLAIVSGCPHDGCNHQSEQQHCTQTTSKCIAWIRDRTSSSTSTTWTRCAVVRLRPRVLVIGAH